MTIFERGKTMLQNLRRTIFGVPDQPSETAEEPQHSLPEYLPESMLTSQEIHAAAADGAHWQFWRRDPDGEAWFRRLAASAVDQPTIRGIEDDEDLIAAPDAGEYERILAEIVEAREANGYSGGNDDLYSDDCLEAGDDFGDSDDE